MSSIREAADRLVDSGYIAPPGTVIPAGVEHIQVDVYGAITYCPPGYIYVHNTVPFDDDVTYYTSEPLESPEWMNVNFITARISPDSSERAVYYRYLGKWFRSGEAVIPAITDAEMSNRKPKAIDLEDE